MFNPEFLTSETDAISGNDLIKYLQEQSPDVLQRVARSAALKSKKSFATTCRACWACCPVSSST